MYQIIEQTKEEKIAMYMKCTKNQLIEMLLENQRIVESSNKTEFTMPKCMKCFDKGYYTIGGSFGGGATEIQCNCKCEHPVENRMDFHDNSIVCTKCNKVIAQNGVFF